jgi:hypothetical protein
MNDIVKTGSADIADLDTSSAETTLELRNPYTDEVLRHEDGRPMTITHLSNESDEFETLARKQQDRRNQQFIRSRAPALSSVTEKDSIELLVAITVRWDILFDGKLLESTPEAYRALYGNPKYKWLRKQLDTNAGNLANFTKG